MYRPPKIASILVIAAMVATLSFSLFGSASKPTASVNANKREISTTIFPLYDITQNIAGEALEVNLILPPGASPHTFEPRPSDVKDVDESKVVYAIGHGVDSWADTIAESTGTPVVVMDKGISLIPFQAPLSTDPSAKSEGDLDPHYWLDVANAKIIAANVATDLSTRFPDSAATFAANATAYEKQLDDLDAEIRTTLAPITNRNLVTMHDAWGYFAKAYGLKIAGSFEPAPGKEPTPAWIGKLASTVAAAKVKTIYAEPQLSSEGIQSFAKDHGLKIVTIDPEGSDSADSYITMLRQNAQVIRDNQ